MCACVCVCDQYHLYRRFNRLVDCALYFNQTCTEKGGASNTVVTLLLDKTTVKLLETPEHQMSAEQLQLAELVQHAQQGGIDVETMLSFFSQWQSHNNTVGK